MKKSFKLVGLDCANCAAKIENAIQKLSGVENATVNFMTTKMIIECDKELMPGILDKTTSIIKKVDSNIKVQKA